MSMSTPVLISKSQYCYKVYYMPYNHYLTQEICFDCPNLAYVLLTWLQNRELTVLMVTPPPCFKKQELLRMISHWRSADAILSFEKRKKETTL